MIFLDLSKANDRVCHKRLLYKLDKMGIKGRLFDWIRSYLSGRSQRVVLSGFASEFMFTFGSLPQGSILAPLLFLIFLNDIESGIQSNISLFADDVALLRTFKNCNDLEQTLNNDLNLLNNWALKWGMEFNPMKTEIMLFSNNKIKSKPNLTFKGIILKQVPSHKHLGVHLSEDMHWTTHINSCVRRVNKKLGQLRRNSYKLKVQQMVDIYKSMIRPILEYGSVLIDNCSTIDSLKLQKCQRTAALICTGAMRRTESKLLMDYLGWESLQDRRKLLKLSTFYKIVHKTAPPYLHKFAVTAEPSNHSLRNRSLFHIERINCRLVSYKKSFIPSTIAVWNTLPDSIQNSNKLLTFKIKIRKHFNIDKQADPSMLYHSHGGFFGKVLNQMKFKLSPLKAHLFGYNMTDNPFCPGCGEKVESTHHFFLTCKTYVTPRQQLLDNMQCLYSSPISNDEILNLIIFGSTCKNINDCIPLNKLIFGYTCMYFYATKRFGSF